MGAVAFGWRGIIKLQPLLHKAYTEHFNQDRMIIVECYYFILFLNLLAANEKADW